MKQRTNEQGSELDELPDILTPAEVAWALRVGLNAAYELLRQGEIRAVRIGRRYRILKSTVLEYLQPKGCSLGTPEGRGHELSRRGGDHAGPDRPTPRR